MSESSTLGECRARLLANGYAPASLLAHRFGGASDGLLAADDPAGVLTWPAEVQRRLAVLVIATQDAKRRGAIWAALERRKYPGPIRTGSDGSEWLLFSTNQHEPPPGFPSDGALVFLSAAYLGPGNGMGSCAIPVAGQWRNGSLLDTPRSALPVFSVELFRRLFEECQPAVQHLELPRYVPTPPTPAERQEARENAMYRKDPHALVARLEELRGDGAQQVAVRMSLLRAVAQTGDDDAAARAWLAEALRAKAKAA